MSWEYAPENPTGQGSDILMLIAYDSRERGGSWERKKQKARAQKQNAHPRGTKETDGKTREVGTT